MSQGLESKIETNDKSIFVVEDCEHQQKMIKRMLKDYKLVIASDGFVASQRLPDFSPSELHCIILDKNMPRMNGYTFALQASGIYSCIPLIATGTGFTDEEISVLSNRYDLLIRLPKPFRVQELRDAVNYCITKTPHIIDKNNCNYSSL